MTTIKTSLRRAVTLTELLVVLAIISLLATIAVPVYVNQLSRARFAIAQTEVRAIAEAQQQAGILHGFYVPIHILDNIANRETGTTNTGNASSRDDFDNLSSSAQHSLIKSFEPIETQLSGSPQLTLSSTDVRVETMIETWQGPFLNPKRIRFVGEDPQVIGSGNLTLDLVVDPWGNPYRFYTAGGIVGSFGLPDSTSGLVLGMDDGQLTSLEADRFDRYAVVSFGPDGETEFTGNPLDQGNDIFYSFAGVSINETRFSGF